MHAQLNPTATCTHSSNSSYLICTIRLCIRWMFVQFTSIKLSTHTRTHTQMHTSSPSTIQHPHLTQRQLLLSSRPLFAATPFFFSTPPPLPDTASILCVAPRREALA